MTEERRYSDFDLLIEGHGEDRYRARVVESPAGQATGDFDLPFSEIELENFMLKVGRPRRGVRRLESPEMEAAREFGTQLFDAVFQDDLKLSLRRSIDEVERRDEGLRIRLWFSDAPELATLPWEFLFSETDDQFLVLSVWTPVIRYLDLTQPIEPLTVTGPLRILAMISSPHDFPELDVEDEWRRIEHALQPLVEAGIVEIERTESATLLELQRLLRRKDYHIFHFLGHGGFDEQANDGVLVLEDQNNRSRLVAGRDVGTILNDHRSLRLAVLNACEGARAGSNDPFSGAAQSLVRKGIPGVVAMQFEITDDAAIAFAQEFYGAIADGLPVDAAIGEARRAIFGQGNDIEWGTPVVYLRGDGRLFDVDAAAVAAGAAKAVVPIEDTEPVEAVEEEAPEEEVETAVVAGAAVATDEVLEDEPVVTAEAEAPVEEEEEEEVSAGPTLWQRVMALPLWLLLGLAGLGLVVVVVLSVVLFAGDGETEATAAQGATSETTEATATTVFADDGVATAKRTSEPKVIDGLADDWPETVIHSTDHVIYQAAPVREDPGNRAGTENDSDIRLAWDDTHLYIYAVVDDDVLSAGATEELIWQNDAVTLNISLAEGDDRQITLSPADPIQGTDAASAHYVVGGSTINWGFADVETIPDGDGGYVLEAAIEWSEVDLMPNAGDVFTALLAVFDNDGEPFPQAEIKANVPPGGEPLDARWFRDPKAWGTFELEG